MNCRKKIFCIVTSLICLFSLFILVSSIINLVQKEYITGGFYTQDGLIIMIVISSFVAFFSILFIVLKSIKK